MDYALPPGSSVLWLRFGYNLFVSVLAKQNCAEFCGLASRVLLGVECEKKEKCTGSHSSFERSKRLKLRVTVNDCRSRPTRTPISKVTT